MVRRSAPKAVAPVEVEETEDEFPLAHLLDKEPSEVHNRFCDYIKDQTGEDVADPKTVQLVISQWQKFQKTPEQQEYTAQRKERSAAAREEADAAREEKAARVPAEKPTRTRAAKATEDGDAAPAPRRGARAVRGAVTPPPAKRATSRRRPVAAVPDAEDLD
jgi:hypothetical protein